MCGPALLAQRTPAVHRGAHLEDALAHLHRRAEAELERLGHESQNTLTPQTVEQEKHCQVFMKMLPGNDTEVLDVLQNRVDNVNPEECFVCGHAVIRVSLSKSGPILGPISTRRLLHMVLG